MERFLINACFHFLSNYTWSTYYLPGTILDTVIIKVMEGQGSELHTIDAEIRQLARTGTYEYQTRSLFLSQPTN